MQDKLVSVIIPVYNVEKYVKEAVESIQNQTYKNLEIIIIDDGSTDKTYDIVKRLAEKDNRIKLYKNDKNLKIVKTLNFGLSVAKGEYIARMDGDDISALDRIEKKVRFLEENNEFDLVGCSVISIDKNGNIIGQTKYFSNPRLNMKILKYTNPVLHIWVARRSVYEELKGYRNIPGVEDYDFLLRMTTKNLKYTNIEDYYGYYVRIGREGNTANLIGLLQRKMAKKVYSLYLERKSKGIDSYEENYINRFYKKKFLLEKIHKYSTQLLYKSIESKKNKKYHTFIIYLLFSIISSPYQLIYIKDRLIYRIILQFYNLKAK